MFGMLPALVDIVIKKNNESAEDDLKETLASINRSIRAQFKNTLVPAVRAPFIIDILPAGVGKKGQAKWTGKFKVGKKAKIKFNKPNGTPLKANWKVRILEASLEGYLVKNWDGEQWWVTEENLK